MAYAWLKFDDQTQPGRRLRRVLNKAEESDDELSDVRDLMIQMRNSDGSQDTDYAKITFEFKFESDAQAHAAFLEIDSAYSKTSGNGSVDNVRAARDQLFAKLRGG